MIRGIIRDVRRLLGYMGGARWYLCAGVTCFAAADFVVMWMLAMLLGDGVAAYQARDVSSLVSAVTYAVPHLIAALTLKGVAAYANGMATARATVAMREELFGAVTRMPLGAAHSVHSGVVLSYITNDVPAAMDALVSTLIAPMSAAIIGVGGLWYVLSINLTMALVALGIGAFTLTYSLLFADKLHRIAASIQQLMAELEIKMKDLLDGMVTVRQFGMRDKLEDGMASAASGLMSEGIRWARWSALLGGLNNAMHYFTKQVMVFAAGYFVLGGTMSLPVLIKVSQMSGGVANVFGVSRLLVSVQKSLAGARRVFAFLDECEQEPSGCDMGHTDAPVAVRFDAVKFSYGGLPVLDNVSFEIGWGELVAVIGPSGCGKSTALRLIQGLYNVSGGRCEVMGMDVGRWDRDVLRHMTALVPQEPVLFPGTVAENIALGSTALNMAKVRECVELARASAFVSGMGGFDGEVTERGLGMSGGERQRLAIARALYRDAPVLLLDEATSALDAGAEAAVNEVLVGLKGKRTVVCVTHREAVVNIADKIIVLSP